MAVESDRVQKLRTMLEKQPNDPFLLYAMGMDLKKSKSYAHAIEYFDRTIQNDPAYCYAYFQKGQTFELSGDVDSAKIAYREGIAAAKAKGDAHAQGEIEQALMMIE